jgi:hypothetical protein
MWADNKKHKMTLHVTNDNNKWNVVFEKIIYIMAGN